MFDIPDDYPYFTGVYYKFFGLEHQTQFVTDLATQKKYDRIVKVNGKTYHVEEKLRKRNYKDVLIEWGETDYPGWIYLSEADYLLYGFPSGETWIISFPELKNLWLKCSETFKRKYYTDYSPNDWCSKKYNTQFTCIPIVDLQRMGIHMKRLR